MYLSLSAKGLLRHSCRDQGSVLLPVWPQVTSLLSFLTAARWWPTGTHWYLGYSICFICFCAHSVSALEEKWSWQVCVMLGILSMKIVSAAVKPIAIISSMPLFELTFSLKQDCSDCVVAVILMQGQPLLSSQLCFISSLLVFGRAVSSPHTCAVSREPWHCWEPWPIFRLCKSPRPFQFSEMNSLLEGADDKENPLLGTGLGASSSQRARPGFHTTLLQFQGKSQLKQRNVRYFWRNLMLNVC